MLFPYNFFGSEWYAFVYRMIVIALSFVMTMAFLSLVPHRKLPFTQTGRRTIYPYVLHTFVYYGLFLTVLYDKTWDLYKVLALIGISIASYLIFSTRFVARIARPLIEPKLKFLFK